MSGRSPATAFSQAAGSSVPRGGWILNGYVIFALAATVLFGANAAGSHAVMRSDFHGSRRKAVQIAWVWLLPIFGLLLVGGVLWSNYEWPSSTGDHPEHKIPDFAWTNSGPNDGQRGGSST
jgi:hypothetical protein